MPKAVFRYFWKTLQANSPIAAYVKNMSSSGGYYWVLASVFPVAGGYISIRVKPSVGILPVIEKVYAQLIAEEARLSIEESEQRLFQSINSLGYKSYRNFSIVATIFALNDRQPANRAVKKALIDCKRVT